MTKSLDRGKGPCLLFYFRKELTNDNFFFHLHPSYLSLPHLSIGKINGKTTGKSYYPGIRGVFFQCFVDLAAAGKLGARIFEKGKIIKREYIDAVKSTKYDRHT